MGKETGTDSITRPARGGLGRTAQVDQSEEGKGRVALTLKIARGQQGSAVFLDGLVYRQANHTGAVTITAARNTAHQIAVHNPQHSVGAPARHWRAVDCAGGGGLAYVSTSSGGIALTAMTS